eukprot:g3849.t1
MASLFTSTSGAGGNENEEAAGTSRGLGRKMQSLLFKYVLFKSLGPDKHYMTHARDARRWRAYAEEAQLMAKGWQKKERSVVRVLDVGAGWGIPGMVIAEECKRAGFKAFLCKTESSRPVAVAVRNYLGNKAKSKGIMHTVVESLEDEMLEALSSKAPFDIIALDIFSPDFFGTSPCCGLLGGGVAALLEELFDRGLVSDQTEFIPQGALLQASLLFVPPQPSYPPLSYPLCDEICGFDLSSFNSFRSDGRCEFASLAAIAHTTFVDVHTASKARLTFSEWRKESKKLSFNITMDGALVEERLRNGINGTAVQCKLCFRHGNDIAFGRSAIALWEDTCCDISPSSTTMELQLNVVDGRLYASMSRQNEAIPSMPRALLRDAAGVARWHYAMLADRDRNEKYAHAIVKAIAKGNVATALDIGTGTGILAMMAAREGASVTAAELNPHIAEVAKRVVSENGFGKEQVTVHNLHSGKLQVADMQGGRKADLLVSEILDVGLLGEGVLPAVRDARERLLEGDAECIPSHAIIRAFLANIDVSGSQEAAPYAPLSTPRADELDVLRPKCLYEQVQLRSLAHEVVSEAFDVFRVDLSNPPAKEESSKTISVQVTGDANFIVFWFDLFLDREGEFVISNDPRKDSDGCWVQAAAWIGKESGSEKKTRGIISILAKMTDTAISKNIKFDDRVFELLAAAGDASPKELIQNAVVKGAALYERTIAKEVNGSDWKLEDARDFSWLLIYAACAKGQCFTSGMIIFEDPSYRIFQSLASLGYSRVISVMQKMVNERKSFGSSHFVDFIFFSRERGRAFNPEAEVQHRLKTGHGKGYSQVGIDVEKADLRKSAASGPQAVESADADGLPCFLSRRHILCGKLPRKSDKDTRCFSFLKIEEHGTKRPSHALQHTISYIKTRKDVGKDSHIGKKDSHIGKIRKRKEHANVKAVEAFCKCVESAFRFERQLISSHLTKDEIIGRRPKILGHSWMKKIAGKIERSLTNDHSEAAEALRSILAELHSHLGDGDHCDIRFGEEVILTVDDVYAIYGSAAKHQYCKPGDTLISYVIARHTRELQQEEAVNHRLEESQKQAVLLRHREDEEFKKAQKRRKHEEEEAKHAARQARLKEEQIQREKKAESEEKFIAENKAKARARERAEEERRINKAKADARLEAQEKLREKVMQREAQEKRQVEVQKAAANEEAKKFKQREAERQAQADEIARADAAHAEEVQKGIEREKAKIFKEIQDAAERRKFEMKTMEESKKEEEARKLKSQNDPYTYISASFRKKGPLGLLFVPGAIPMVLSSSSGELKEGDELCSVNDEDVLEADSLNDIAEIIAEAPYPKMLKFRRLKPVKKVETLDAGGKTQTMVVVKPGILSGYKIEYQLAKFGAKEATSCRAREIFFAVPFDLCSSPRLGLTGSISDAILLSTRGGCMFSVKADNVEELNPHALAVINTDEKLMAMPFPKNKEPKFSGPSLLMKKSDGDFIRLVHSILNADETEKTKIHVRAQLGNSCGALVGDEKYRRNWGGSGEGRLLIHSGKREEEFEIVKAAFGTPIDNKPFRAIIADPISGCDEKGFKQNVKNAFVIVERGNCPFIEKAKIVKTAGGIGLIVINTNKKMIKMPAGPSGSQKVKIPAIMIPSGSLAKLKSLRNEAETKAAKSSFIGRLVFKEE